MLAHRVAQLVVATYAAHSLHTECLLRGALPSHRVLATQRTPYTQSACYAAHSLHTI
jgi:hypothetical protein